MTQQLNSLKDGKQRRRERLYMPDIQDAEERPECALVERRHMEVDSETVPQIEVESGVRFISNYL